MNQFKVLPASPALQELVRSEDLHRPVPVKDRPVPVKDKPGLWQEEMTQTHRDIMELFKHGHGNKIVEMAKKEGKVHAGTWKYGPYRLNGYLNAPSDSVCTFIPLKNADGADASSQKVWNQVGSNEPERVIWQTESPFRIPAYGRLYIEDANVRFLMERYIFAVDGDGEET